MSSRTPAKQTNMARKHVSKILDELIPESKLDLDSSGKRVAESFLERKIISRDVHGELEDDRNLGERVADRVAAFGGSWAFIFIFFAVLAVWVLLNSYVLVFTSTPFDPYPFILLNLFLSMLAAIQAPVILMSQNRQAVKDRAAAEHDYEVNLKSELEVRYLHEKLDELRELKWVELVQMQQKQIELLEQISKGSLAIGARRYEPDTCP
jgi:uncharacterized membrane protein